MPQPYRIYFDDQQHRAPLEASLDFSKRWPEYDELRKKILPLLGGNDIERVNVFWSYEEGHPPRYLDMFVDDEGAMNGRPVNTLATRIYHHNVKVHDPSGLGSPMALASAPPICGTAVLFRYPIWS